MAVRIVAHEIFVRDFDVAASRHAVPVGAEPVLVAATAAVGELLALLAPRVVEVPGLPRPAGSALWVQPTEYLGV